MTGAPGWERTRYEPGGGDAFLFFAVFGAIDLGEPMSRTRHRSDGPPEGLEPMAFNRRQHRDVLDDLRQGEAWEELRRTSPLLGDKIATAASCTVIKGFVPDPTSLDYLRDVIGLVTYLLERGGLAVYDPLMLRWWAPEDWRRDLFDPDVPAPQRHVSIRVVEEHPQRGRWFHTRGMRKFGRPDLSVSHTPRGLEPVMRELFARFIRLHAMGGVIPEGRPITMEGLPVGMHCRHRGRVDDPDFLNVHVEILWP